MRAVVVMDVSDFFCGELNKTKMKGSVNQELLKLKLCNYHIFSYRKGEFECYYKL